MQKGTGTMQLVVLFEDHTAQRLRPLSWSVPTYEIPCGLLTPRERLALLLAGRDDVVAALWPRSLLHPLQEATAPAGFRVGTEAVRREAGSVESVLLLAGRVLCRPDEIRALLDDPAPALRRDEAGVLALRCGARDLPGLLDDWQDWERRQAEAGAWTRDGVVAEPWQPRLPSVAPSSDGAPTALVHLWDVVPRLAGQIEADARLLDGGRVERRLFGVVSDRLPDWSVIGPWRRSDGSGLPDGVWARGEGGILLGPDVELAPGVVLDARHGPVILDAGVTVQPHVVLAGPLYLGAGTRVKAGAAIGGETAAGPCCRLAGEIAETQLAPLVNKQHAGFIGHAVIGSWCNLGADTTCSDLKNNYGEIKVNYGLGPVATGHRFVGLMMAEHAKSAIGTTFNTGTTVGFASNVFAAGFPRSTLPNFTWGDGRGHRRFQVDRAIETATIVMARRDCRFTDRHADLFRALSGEGA